MLDLIRNKFLKLNFGSYVAKNHNTQKRAKPVLPSV